MPSATTLGARSDAATSTPTRQPAPCPRADDAPVPRDTPTDALALRLILAAARSKPPSSFAPSRAALASIPSGWRDFFASPAGCDFLHRLYLVLIYVFGVEAAVGMPRVRRCFELLGLSQLVACSDRTLQRKRREVLTAIHDYEDQEVARLSLQMPERPVVLLLDEHFHEGTTLVAIDALSGYLLLQTKAPNCDEGSWAHAWATHTKGLRVSVVRACGDGASGFAAFVRTSFGLGIDPDLFHVQRDVVTPLCAPVANALRRAERPVVAAEAALAAVQAAPRAPRAPGQPREPDYVRERPARRALRAARWAKQKLEARRERLFGQIRALGTALHPYDLATGATMSAERLGERLASTTFELGVQARTWKLFGKIRAGIERLERTVPRWQAHVAWFHALTKSAVAELAVPLAVQTVVLTVLLPYAYLVSVLRRSERREDRELVRQTLHRLQRRLLAPGSAWLTLPRGVRRSLWEFSHRYAAVFVRASSAVEGRNGRASLEHHQRHRISPAVERASRVVHNFAMVGRDGRTPAERLFKKKPRSLIAAVLRAVSLPAAPRRGHASSRRFDRLTPLLDAR